jgi:hypothetical protein
LKKSLGGDVEGVGVAEAAAADAAAADDGYVFEGGQPEDPAQADPRRPEVAAQVPGGLREVLVAEALAALEDVDRVALLGQAQGRDRSAESRTDDYPVKVKLAHQPGL